MKTTQGQKIYRHKKSGRLYWLICEALDCTNERDGTRVAIYQADRRGAVAIYVREWQEFNEKFEVWA